MSVDIGGPIIAGLMVFVVWSLHGIDRSLERIADHLSDKEDK